MLVQLGIGISILVIIIVDIFLATDGIKGNTISEIIRNWSLHFSVVSYSVGVLCTHWFGLNARGPLFGQPSSAVFLGWSALVITIAGFILSRFDISIHPMIPLFLGMIAGYFLWSGS